MTRVGAPRRCRQKYFADGCSDIQRQRLEADGFVIDFETMPKPYACKRNNPGASDPDYTPWLYGMIEESLLLTILVELDHRPFVRLPINVVTKSGYDVTSAPWRLRRPLCAPGHATPTRPLLGTASAGVGCQCLHHTCSRGHTSPWHRTDPLPTHHREPSGAARNHLRAGHRCVGFPRTAQRPNRPAIELDTLKSL